MPPAQIKELQFILSNQRLQADKEVNDRQFSDAIFLKLEVKPARATEEV